MQNFKLISKKKLTYNVFELIFEWENELNILPWQFVTFILDKIWGRAYSILRTEWKNVILIIKKWELEEWWRWWSKYICELNEWDILRWVWPAWHFLLKENNRNKLFIGTGTWLVPLYNQIIWALDKNLNIKLELIFWAREKIDLFYLDNLDELKTSHPNFDYKLYLSREEIPGINKWYVTDYLTKNNLEDFEEFYICGMPNMIESTIEKLRSYWIPDEDIYFEKY